MPSLSYKTGFVDYVEEGLKKRTKKRVKRQTIRNIRKVPIKKGDVLHHFFGMRTKWCRKLGTSVCTSVERIIINHHAVYIGSKEITRTEELNAFAYADGFQDWDGMKRWWMLVHGTNCFPFIDQLIKW